MKHCLVAWLCCGLIWSTAQAAGSEPGAHPLLDLARELEADRSLALRPAPDAPELRHAEHALEQARPPPDADCARSLGAGNFAELHLDLGRARAAKGDYTGAAEAYRRAHACRPRNAGILGAIAEVLFDARDFEGSRAAIHQALSIDQRNVSLHRVAGNLDFIAERWADAVTRFRYVASSDPDRDQAGYGQLMYWLAQMRAGVAQPTFVSRRAGEGWPQPLLLYLRNEYTEADVVEQIRAGDDHYNSQPHTSTDERLCEALFYIGEAHWARGDRELARRYFAALVNIRVIYFLEHGLALAEIAKLNRGQTGSSGP